jgi:thiamine-phosphate pyrophosphorylase
MTRHRYPPLKGLYAITPETHDTPTLVAQVDAIMAGGVTWLQYRSKQQTTAVRLEQAMALAQLSRIRRVGFIVNDDIALAQAVDADGVHLGQGDLSIAAARAAWPDGVIGSTCHDRLDLAHTAVAAGASYVAFGAVFPSIVKPNAVRASATLLRTARAQLTGPICAIGGITLDNIDILQPLGIDLFAVVTDLFAAADPSARATALAQKLHSFPRTFD